MQAKRPQLLPRQPCCKRQRHDSISPNAVSPSESTPIGVGEIADVEDVEGIRVVVGEANRPLIEYLIKWKVDSTSHEHCCYRHAKQSKSQVS